MYLYDSEDHELARFKDIAYAYHGTFKPHSNIFLLKSTAGRIAVYDCDEQKLLHKFKYSDIDAAQDGGFCFSPDGKQFMNIEIAGPNVHSRLSIYDTQSFSPTTRLFETDESLALCDIEYDEAIKSYALLFFRRDDQGTYQRGYVGKLDGDQITQAIPLTCDAFDFLRSYKSLESMGFTEKAMEWSGVHHAGYTHNEILKLRDKNISLMSFPEIADRVMK